MADDAAALDDEQGEVDAAQRDESVTETVDADDEVADEAAEDEVNEVDEVDDETDDGDAGKPPMSHVRLATIVGLVAVLVLAGLVGWLGFRAYQSHQTDVQRRDYLAVGRQGAVNLTTIDFEHVDSDVKRILDSATGTFYDDFQQRSGPFVQVVKEVKSKSVGTVTEAGVESVSADNAQVLVAVSVNTSVVGQPDQRPRSWRMRILLQKVGDEPKVSNVEFVP